MPRPSLRLRSRFALSRISEWGRGPPSTAVGRSLPRGEHHREHTCPHLCGRL